MELTNFQKEFVQFATDMYTDQILESMFGCPEEIDEIPEWAQKEVTDLFKKMMWREENAND